MCEDGAEGELITDGADWFIQREFPREGSFKAYASGTTSPAQGVWTKLELNELEYDMNDEYDTGDYGWSPRRAGRVMLIAEVAHNPNADGNSDQYKTAIYKDPGSGTPALMYQWQGDDASSADTITIGGMIIDETDGNDTYYVYIYAGEGSENYQVGVTQTFFQGCMLR